MIIDGTEEGAPIRETVEERYQRSYKEVCLMLSVNFFFCFFFSFPMKYNFK